LNKHEFLSELSRLIGAVPDEDREKSLEYYSEMIDDRIEDGMTEDEAVADIGTPAEAAVQILSASPHRRDDTPKDEVPKRKLQGWEIALLILGAPLWIPLLAAALVIVLSVYIVVWTVAITLYAVPVSLMGSGLGAVISSVMRFIEGTSGAAMIMLGGGFVLIGLAVFAFFGCNALFGLAVTFTKKSALGFISMIRRKEKKA